jgi:hypothetical protein
MRSKKAMDRAGPFDAPIISAPPVKYKSGSMDI